MKNVITTIGFCLVFLSFANAQTPNFGRAIGVDAGIVSLGNVADPGFAYGISYTRHFANDRLTIGGRIGYADAPGRNSSYYTNEEVFHSYGRKSERFTADLTLSYNFLSSTRHALRLGIGPSVWSRKDDVLQGMVFVKESIESAEIIRVDFLREEVQEVNFGANLIGEYQYALTSSLALGVRGGFAQFSQKKTGFNPMGGISLGYRF